jgi:hypothetical protein
MALPPTGGIIRRPTLITARRLEFLQLVAAGKGLGGPITGSNFAAQYDWARNVGYVKRNASGKLVLTQVGKDHLEDITD